MKEEVRMKRSGARGALAGWVAAFVVISFPMSGMAQVSEDIYENVGGLAGSTGIGGATFPPGVVVGPGTSNATYNPNGIGQYLVGSYYDVRPVNGDASVVNIAILNTNTNNPNLPPCTQTDVLTGKDGENCYYPQNSQSGLPRGGILAKVRFRESRFSSEILDFNIALSCGEVWTGRLELPPGGGQPRLFSDSLIVVDANSSELTTAPAFNGDGGQFGQCRFAPNAPASLTPADAQRGYIEVIGIADLPCEPVDQDGKPTSIDPVNGNTWQVPSPATMATNALAAEAIIVRAASGVSFGYPFDAISRFRPVFGTPTIAIDGIFGNDTPRIDDCLVQDIDGNPVADPDACTRQFNLAYHKSRLVGQYDISPTTAGKTNFVVTLPTKYMNCVGNPGQAPTSKAYPQSPFTCGLGGEKVTCTLYDRLENLAQEGFTSPSTTEECFLPRELTILGLPSSENADAILTPAPNFKTPAGWLAIQLDRATDGTLLHGEVFPGLVPTYDILGGRVAGYDGLPALGLRLQQYENGNVGGTYGAIIKMQSDDPVIFAGQS